MFRFKK